MLILFGKSHPNKDDSTVNIVWQYLYTMRLSKLKGLTEDEEPLEPSGSNEGMLEIDKLRYASEKFEQTLKKYSREHLFWKKIQVPEGDIHLILMKELIPFTFVNYNEEKYLGDITLKIDFIPNMDPKPVIPLNILQISVENFIDDLVKINPDLLNKSIYPERLMNTYHLKFLNVTVFPANGIIHLRDFMDTPTYNLKLLSPNPFGDIMSSRSHLKNVYSLIPGDLPTFADNYTSSMEKLVHKAKHVYHALKKGTWKGHTYVLDTPINWKSGVVIHQDRNDYNKTDKIIHSNFSASLNLAWEYVDGVKNSKEESVLPPEEREEFRNWLKKRFEHFGIGY
jgi:hypothetical protein